MFSCESCSSLFPSQSLELSSIGVTVWVKAVQNYITANNNWFQKTAVLSCRRQSSHFTYHQNQFFEGASSWAFCFRRRPTFCLCLIFLPYTQGKRGEKNKLLRHLVARKWFQRCKSRPRRDDFHIQELRLSHWDGWGCTSLRTVAIWSGSWHLMAFCIGRLEQNNCLWGR